MTLADGCAREGVADVTQGYIGCPDPDHGRAWEGTKPLPDGRLLRWSISRQLSMDGVTLVLRVPVDGVTWQTRTPVASYEEARGLVESEEFVAKCVEALDREAKGA